MNSDSFGVALTKCFFCLGDSDIVMNTRLYRGAAKRVEQLNGKVISLHPCTKCAEFMKRGVILLSFDPEKSDKGWNKQTLPNPYRTGGFFVVRDEAIKRIFDPSVAEFALKNRWIYIEHDAAVSMGLFADREAGHEG